ncbi:dTDP-4-dehydrorhamnose reductase [Aquibacillus koreensis]|uniref:dTDP-4-dehydrorhamnose reductase n=1 Tax=Aquibacillus koreensis TaxID=279446 RepID=A0A9X3WH62_9BACI|nr:dTDP-4-dehydrorhamnose reductase [Aquibacillus koreensis]MCT2534648.1 dTDP-4-dehydrorhamnose reductase [Aquibacillus koreensis]MDC3419832.1 dTDP-4-dehydrorhamnose reductase [Aquibacillus koreensis]
MKVLVTGYTGQLGYDVVREGKNRGISMLGIGREDLDITNEAEVYQYVQKANPDVIIHCAAYTAVDKAEDDKETCWDVNVLGTKFIAIAANKVNAKLMYISTDYVFDGKGESPFTEADIPNPVGYYGLTKYEGEKILKDLLDEHFIVRISWVFGINGHNFIRTMLRLSETRNELNVVGDQYGSPTYTFDLARLLIDMIQTEKYGVYHASNEGFCTWAEFASEIFQQTKKDVTVNSISTEEYPTRAVRPKNSRMSKQKLVDNGFDPLPKWQDALKHYLNELAQEVK